MADTLPDQSPFDNGHEELFSVPQLIGFFALAVPSTTILQALGMGWNGTVVCITGSALTMVFAKPLYAIAKERIPALQSGLPDWKTLFLPVTFDDEQQVIEGTLSTVENDTNTKGSTSDMLTLGTTLTLHADLLLSKRIGIFGLPGSGKSNAIAVFCEELGKLSNIGVPFVLADTEDEYGPLCTTAYLMRPHKAHAGNVTPETAYQFGQQVLDEGLQVVLNLQSYATDDEAALVMIGIISGLRATAEAKENSERATCLFILDEASIWLPQNSSESMLSKEKDEHGLTILARLQQTFFGTVVRRGRKRGIGFLFATQRIAELDNRAIQCNWLLLFRQTLTNDLARYHEMGIDKDAASALAPGEAFVIDPTGSTLLHQLRKRRSPDKSQTPGLASLKKYAEQWAVYKNAPSVNAETGVNALCKQAVNSSRSPFVSAETDDCLRLQDTAPFERETEETPSVNAVNVNTETRSLIKRMVQLGYKHREIARIVQLDGRKYRTYKQLCAEEGITME